ncbi:MAG: alpha/beta hydrolase [Candidatus Acidiferrales bacterium]
MLLLGVLRIPAILFFVACLFGSITNAQQLRPERTIEEIKVEAMSRAENGQYPCIGLNPDDLREAFEHIKTRDRDEWAAAFIAVGDKWMAEGKSLEATDPAKANADYVRAWKVYSFGRWPVPNSPGKQRAYEKAMEAFRAHTKFWDPPMEIVHIPFEGKEITGYVRLPKNATRPVPFIIAVNGLDSRKEDLAESFSAVLPYGIGYIAVDGPGTGQAPIKASPTADRMLSRVIDYVYSRPDVDKTKVELHGVSWGAYWGAKMAIVEKDRLKAVSVQSPPIHDMFQKEYVLSKLQGNREYLFDQLPAMMSIFDNVNNIDELVEIFSKMSLINQGLLGKPTAPMLIMAGVLDTQVPISDVYRLLSAGDVPKTGWINPLGGHLGRQNGVWPDPVMFREVIIPWIVHALGAEPPMQPQTPSK